MVVEEMKTTLPLILVALVVGCTSQAPEEPPMAMGRDITEFGDFTPSEVATIRSGVLKLDFPAPVGSVVRLLPRPLPEVPVSFSDYAPDQEKKGRMGGNVVEYWLNREFCLRVASAYYARGEEHFTMEEWAVVLSRKERETFSRAIYLGDFVEKKRRAHSRRFYGAKRPLLTATARQTDTGPLMSGARHK